METALILVGIAVVVLGGEALSERFNVPAPLLLIAVGAAASYVPVLPEIHLEPEVVLLGLLPPLLYTASIQTSLVDFTANRTPILALSVGLVVVTTFAVGAVVNWLIPDLGWPAALAIGAVVAPPDAVAATAIGRRIGLPRRIVTILEGESLLNDATALVALRTAIAAIAGAVSLGEIGLDFLVAAGGGAAAGFIVFALVAWLRRRVTTPVIDTTISLITPCAAYMLAESVHASGVIAVVVAGLLLGHKAPIIQTAPSRIAERTTWGAIAFLLENAVFLLIGLQTRWIVEDVIASHLPLGWIVLVCVTVLATVIVVRLGWIFALRVPLLLTSNRGAPAGCRARSWSAGPGCAAS
ncbi:cation:proton antiporter [Propioniciclava coleopterorum]|uniref:cation:proton antiporter n=1 Tax=Propioniciclava coleopterorum TaxID=2714937 RepID=UPI00197EFC5F|nr:cation:proton antiporter [Propioniciclava coleopterorum]